MVNTTFNNIAVILKWSIYLLRKSKSIRRKPPTWRKYLENFFT